ncbi:hypothetical protein D9M70_384250 [compost metagenome]
MHADEARSARKDRTDQKAESGGGRKKNPSGDENDNTDDGNGLVLTREIGLRPFTNVACDFLHAGVPPVGGHHRLCCPDGINHREQPACDNAQ